VSILLALVDILLKLEFFFNLNVISLLNLCCTIARISIQIKYVARIANTSGAAIKTSSTDDNANVITGINLGAHVNIYARQWQITE
jgi:cobalamin biosynthesis protein CbiD